MSSVELFVSGVVPGWTAERIQKRLDQYARKREDITSVETLILSPNRPHLEPVEEGIPLSDEHVLPDFLGPIRTPVAFFAAISVAGSVVYGTLMSRVPIWFLAGALWHLINLSLAAALILGRARVCALRLLLRNFEVYYLVWQVIMARTDSFLHEARLDSTAFSIVYVFCETVANVGLSILCLICNDAFHGMHHLKGLCFIVGLLYFTFRYFRLRLAGPLASDIMTCDYILCFSTHAINQEANAVLAAFCFKFFYSFYIKQRDYVFISFRSGIRPPDRYSPIPSITRMSRTESISMEVTAIVKRCCGKRRCSMERDGTEYTRIIVTVHRPLRVLHLRLGPGHIPTPSPSHRRSRSVFRQNIVRRITIVPLNAERDITGPAVFPFKWLLKVARHPISTVSNALLTSGLAAAYVFRERMSDGLLIASASLVLPALGTTISFGALIESGVLWQLGNSFVFWFLMKNLLVFGFVAVHQAVMTSVTPLRGFCSAVLAVYVSLDLMQCLCAEAIRVSRTRLRWYFARPCAVLVLLFFASRGNTERDWTATMCLGICANASVLQENAAATTLAYFMRYWWALWHNRRYALIKFGAMGRAAIVNIPDTDSAGSSSSTE